MEHVRHSARDPDLRHLESAIDGRRTRLDTNGHRSLRKLLSPDPGRRPMSGLSAARVACLIGLIPSVPEIALAAGADDADMARCAAITQPRARLACFDALAAASANRGAPASGQTPLPVPVAPAPAAIAPKA